MKGPEKIGSEISGFKLIKVQQVKEIDSTARLFEHKKTGAQLLYLSNKDDNKVFSIGFRTPPEDSTGIAHILEHSVLCGSRKFPLKEPFVELIKGSVNTFLNAMTYPDKTLYPVASRNSKDFRNLVDVYLDAVFYPRVAQDPLILKQEGWRFETDAKTKEFQYNGVVYNEMKGNYSSPDSRLFDLALQGLFPATPYRFDSGGDPAVIPSLTQKQFTDFHKKYYHPSNSMIFLYGDGDIQDDLKFIDQEYLTRFEKERINSKIAIQKPLPRAVSREETYSLNPKDPIKGRTFLGTSWAIGRATDAELSLALDILEYILLETPASPLKRALMDAKIGEEVQGFWENGIQQPVFGVIVKNSDAPKRAVFLKTIEKTLKALAKNGLDRKLVEAAINKKEFLLREFEVRRYPKGLAYNGRVLDSWLYNGDPLVHLQYEPLLVKFREGAGKRYFEKLIEKHLIANRHRNTFVLKPERGKDAKDSKALAKKLATLKRKLSPTELKQIEADAAALKLKQQTPDSPEALETIPLLELSDLKKEAEHLPRVEKKLAGVPFLQHPLFTNRIAYVDLYFDASAVPQEQLGYLPLLASMMGKLDTEHYSFQELSKETDTHLGALSQGFAAIPRKESVQEFDARFLIRSKALVTKLPKLVELLTETALHTRFEDKARIKEILAEKKAELQSAITSSGWNYARLRTLSYFSVYGAVSEQTDGLDYYRFIADLEKRFDKDSDEIISKLKDTAALVLNRKGLLVSVTSSDEDFAANTAAYEQLVSAFPERELQKQNYKIAKGPTREGLIIPSQVQYVSLSANFQEFGIKYSGTMNVAETLLGTDFLWNRVRVQGGAYGARVSLSRSGAVSLTSYRDPNLKETLDVYAEIAEYFDKLTLSERELRKFILGTIGSLDAPLTPSQKGEVDTQRYLAGITQKDIQKARDEVLSTRVDDLKKLASLFRQAVDKKFIAVLGSEKKMKENSDRFERMVEVLK